MFLVKDYNTLKADTSKTGGKLINKVDKVKTASNLNEFYSWYKLHQFLKEGWRTVATID